MVMRSTWFTLSGALFLLASFSPTHALQPLDLWLKRLPMAAENDLFAIAQGGGRYVTVGNKGIILVSTNGVQWSLALGESDTRLDTVAYGHGVFVAGGWSNDWTRTSFVLVSSNGVDWMQSNLVSDRAVMSVAFGNGRFVAHFSENTPSQISTNGLDWISATNEVNHDIGNIVWGAGLFLAGEYGAIVYSTNGLDWDSRAAPIESPQRVAFVNNRFVVMGDVEDYGSPNKNFATSPDGVNWTTNIFTAGFGDYNGGNGYAVGYVANQYIVLGSVNGLTTVWASGNEGQQWLSVTPPDFIGAPADLLTEANRLIVVGAKGGIATSSNGFVWTPVHGSSGRKPWTVTYGRERFVAAGGAGEVYTSADGQAWTSQKLPPMAQGWFGATYGGNRFVVTGNGATATSVNGTNWSLRTFPTFAALTGVAYGGGQYVAVGDGFFNNSFKIFSSSNALDWSNRLSGAGYALYGITHANGYFTAVGSFGRILNSSNGINWTESVISPQVFFWSIAYGNGTYVAVGASLGLDGTRSIPAVYTSINRVDWSPATFISTNKLDLYSVTFGDGVFLAAGARAPTSGSTGGRLLSSVDGKVWQERFRLPQPQEYRDFTGVGYGRGTFIAVGPSSDIYQTPDVRAQLRFEPFCAAGCPRLWLHGFPDALYAVEASTNLIHWHRFTTNRATVTPLAIPAEPVVGRSFFRTVMIPD
jgi:hypothetical protein